jgi:hypothetical protein
MTFNNIGKKEIQGMYFKWQTLKILQVQNLWIVGGVIRIGAQTYHLCTS